MIKFKSTFRKIKIKNFVIKNSSKTIKKASAKMSKKKV